MKKFHLVIFVGALCVFSQFRANLRAEEWTAEDKLAWQRAVKKVVTTPPCCGACAVLSMSEGRKAYKNVIGEEKSEEGEKIYSEHKKQLLDAFHYFNSDRFEHWFGKKTKEETNEK